MNTLASLSPSVKVEKLASLPEGADKVAVSPGTARKLVRQASDICFVARVNGVQEVLIPTTRQSALNALSVGRSVPYVLVSEILGALVIG